MLQARTRSQHMPRTTRTHTYAPLLGREEEHFGHTKSTQSDGGLEKPQTVQRRRRSEIFKGHVFKLLS